MAVGTILLMLVWTDDHFVGDISVQELHDLQINTEAAIHCCGLIVLVKIV